MVPSVLKAITIVRPETLVRWHRAGFRRYWRWKSRSLGADRRLLPVSVVGCYFWVDRPLALFAHDQTKQFDIFITLTYIPEVLTAPVLVAFVVLGLRALNNQPLSRLQTTAVLAVASLAIAELLKVQLKFIFGAFATLTINVPPSRLTATLDDGHALRASSIACWVSQDGR